MPTSRELEHEGGEFFEEQIFPNREEYTKFQEDIVKELKEMKHSELVRKQNEWMDIENPFLWEPIDID